jgi:hypothetical protein
MLLVEEKFTTNENDVFTLSIGDFTGKLIIDTEENWIRLNKEELKHFIEILTDYYERLD